MGTHRVTIELTDDSYQMLRQAIDSGEFESESDVISCGLMALGDPDLPSNKDKIEAWLRDEVVPIALRVQANPGSGYTSEEVMAHLEADLKASEVRPDAA